MGKYNDQTVTHFLACFLLGALEIELFAQNKAISVGLIYPNLMFAAASLQETYSSFSASNPTSVENKTRFSKSQSPLRVGQSQIRALCKGLIPGFLLLHSDVSTTCLENPRRETFPGNLGCHRSFGAASSWMIVYVPMGRQKIKYCRNTGYNGHVGGKKAGFGSLGCTWASDFSI